MTEKFLKARILGELYDELLARSGGAGSAFAPLCVVCCNSIRKPSVRQKH